MKSIIATAVLGMFLLGSALAGNVVKFTFTDQTFPDGRMGTIRASVKETKKSMVTVCEYSSNPNDQYLGQYEDHAFASSDANEVRDFCLSHYDDRTPAN